MARIVPWLEASDVIAASRDVLRKEPGHSEFIHSIVIGRLDSVGGRWNQQYVSVTLPPAVIRTDMRHMY